MNLALNKSYNEIKLKLTSLSGVIVPAVQSIRAAVNSSGFQRQVQKLSYAKARQRWWILLHFNSDIDLMIFEKAVKGSDIRLIELADKFYLEDLRIPDTSDMSEAESSAKAVLAQTNAAIRVLCPHFQNARFEYIVELMDNGSGRGIVAFDFVVHGTSSLPGIREFLLEDATPMNSILPIWKSNKNVQEAFYYLGAEGDHWANLYKAWEIVDDDVPRDSTIVERGWCTKAALTRFRHTANHQEAIGRFSRHARMKTVPPPDPMDIGEARVFVRDLVSKWIDSMKLTINCQIE